MPDIPEKYKTLREITEAIAKADDEIIENHQESTQRAKRYGRAVISQRRVRRRQITSRGAHRESDGGLFAGGGAPRRKTRDSQGRASTS